jgi:homoserine kinase type II
MSDGAKISAPNTAPAGTGNGGKVAHPANPANSGSAAGVAVPSAPNSTAGSGQRERFTVEEIACILSHFDIGVITAVTEYPRGSRKAPKLLIESEKGRYLLKRRARGRDDPFKVAFCHALQMHLASQQFPLPHLIGTRAENNSMLQWRGGVYELFEYIPGQPYPQTLEATFDAGRVLGLYHKLLGSFESQWQPPFGSYHRAAAVQTGLVNISAALATKNGSMPAICQFLKDSYAHAADTVDALGLPEWPKQIAHGDWHPGNMLFRDNHIVAVIDYDSARVMPRIIDIANGALQFSILGGDEDISRWPEYLDESRFKRFLRGYDGVLLLSKAELEVVPWLMIEALIAEAVFPIAATGHFGRMEGSAFLTMVQRKVVWMQRSAEKLVALVEA